MAKSLSLWQKPSIVLNFVGNNQILGDKKYFGFEKNIKKKKGPNTKQNPKKKIQNPTSLDLFTFVILLLVDACDIVVIILLLCSRKWLLSYVLLCPQNLESKFTTSPNGTTTRLTTRPFLIEIGTEHGSWNLSFFFLAPTTICV
jgi:hypothetical protein